VNVERMTTKGPMGRDVAFLALALLAIAVGCGKAKKATSKERAAETLIKEHKESPAVTKQCREAFEGCRFDRISDSRKLDSGEPWVNYFYTIPVELFDGTNAKMGDVTVGFSLTKYKSSDEAKAAARDRKNAKDFLGVVIEADCVGDACRKIKDRAEFDRKLGVWVDYVHTDWLLNH